MYSEIKNNVYLIFILKRLHNLKLQNTKLDILVKYNNNNIIKKKTNKNSSIEFW